MARDVSLSTQPSRRSRREYLNDGDVTITVKKCHMTSCLMGKLLLCWSGLEVELLEIMHRAAAVVGHTIKRASSNDLQRPSNT